MIIHEMEQRSQEWFDIRQGKMTASEAACIAANGKGLETYIYRLVVEKITGVSQDSFAGNLHTARGNELESEARLSYEIVRDVTVRKVGFIEIDEFTGCSPDGLVGDDGGFEAKCPNNVKYFRLLTGIDKIDTAYEWQCQMSMLLTGRQWWNLVYYNPHFDKSMLIHRIEPDIMKREKLIIGIEKGKSLIKELNKKYEQSRNL